MAELEFVGTKKQNEGNDNPFFDKQIVVTGTFENFDRAALLTLLEKFGAIVKDSISKTVDYLIYGNLPGSKKVGDALACGTTMISEQKFIEMLSQNR